MESYQAILEKYKSIRYWVNQVLDEQEKIAMPKAEVREKNVFTSEPKEKEKQRKSIRNVISRQAHQNDEREHQNEMRKENEKDNHHRKRSNEQTL